MAYTQEQLDAIMRQIAADPNAAYQYGLTPGAYGGVSNIAQAQAYQPPGMPQSLAPPPALGGAGSGWSQVGNTIQGPYLAPPPTAGPTYHPPAGMQQVDRVIRPQPSQFAPAGPNGQPTARQAAAGMGPGGMPLPGSAYVPPTPGAILGGLQQGQGQLAGGGRTFRIVDAKAGSAMPRTANGGFTPTPRQQYVPPQIGQGGYMPGSPNDSLLPGGKVAFGMPSGGKQMQSISFGPGGANYRPPAQYTQPGMVPPRAPAMPAMPAMSGGYTPPRMMR